MLEKIGLPAKPSMRGGSWVVDASHCQGCSSQFTFINRKHHCRRCGGLFCNSCTQQRMVLRLQGDSPVRICNPCKNLEEAARFELRHGHKSRAVKGTSKQSLKHEDEILSQIIGASGKQESGDITTSDLLRAASTASSSSLNEESAVHGREGDRDTLIDVESCSPEELRQQAVEEKKKYKILKGEGKSDEALQTFKRAKELERQAGALEIAIRKNRRMASKASTLSSVPSNQKIDNSEEPTSKKNLPQRKGKEEKDDLAAELRDLGWSDADLHDADNKPVKLSVEGELSNLLGEISQSSSSNKKTGGVDKSQVVALKKKALQLKREGKLAEAKEELKRAKILEKQLEEQELLGDSEESDDELSALIRNMDDDKHDDFLLNHHPVPNINFDQFGIPSDDLVIDNNFDVTDDDMNDPELANALRSFGWTEEDDDQAIDDDGQPNLFDQEALRGKILTLKREALSQKRAGNVAEAMTLLKKAKLLEKDLETVQSDTQASQENIPKSSVSRVYGESVAEIADEENIAKLPPKSKIAIQKELLAIKKKALALRREGRTNEADEELQKGKLLEQQLEEMENGPKRPVPKVAQKNVSNLKPDNIHMGDPGTLDLGDVGEEAEVTEQDMHDPALMSVLKNLGWNEEDTDPVSMTNRTAHDSTPSVISRKPTRSKTEIQRELLALKRKALGLRRQGKTEEAEEELEKAKDLERQLAEMEASSIAKFTEVQSQDLGTLIPKVKPDFIHKADGDLSSLMSRIVKDEENYLKREVTKNPSPSSSLSVPEITGTELESFGKPGHVTEEGSSSSVSAFSQSEDINPFRHSSIDVSQSREKADREHSRDPNFSPPAASVQPTTQVIAKESNINDNVIAGKLVTPEQNSTLGINAQRDEVLARKRKAVALKREGKLAEAREELKQAKLLEKNLEEANQQTVVETTAEVASTSNSPPVIRESKTNQQAQKPLSGRDRFKLQQESLAHKRKALKLRREGKIEESEAEFELAKALESQLEDFDTQGSNTNTAGKVEGMNDVGVEDLLDPQLMSALKSIGWEDSDIGAHQPTGAQPSKKLEQPPTVGKGGKPQGERAHLEDMIKAEKVRALNLKREGKQGEALQALRSAKLLEKKLGSLT
ncbi:uncharacterized protein M6B38_358850 [Iris pallida]|uniref:FYVE-type domain-containing protein n=1 Tax=Iris pallida TaxID=29817 RepID=A0AAX6GK55_IRIPA|nr:uncharacterized protein M6B38_358850 [Iris pallida]